MLHVTEARYTSGKTIWVSFDDSASGEIDLTGHLQGPVFEILKDDAELAKLKFDEELETVVWPNGADFTPEFLRSLLSEIPAKQCSA